MPGARNASAVASLLVIMLAWSALPSAPPARASLPACADTGQRPVLQDSGWLTVSPGFAGFSTYYTDSSVLKPGSTYHMYVREILNLTSDGIFLGTSADGVHWSMSPTPVLKDGPKGAWDSSAVLSPDVLWNGTGFMMYYVGDGNFRSNNLTELRQIGVAFSYDGVHWTKYAGNPVIVHGPGPYDQHYTRGPSVLYDGGGYRMWYQGAAAANATVSFLPTIEYATSPDGLHWTKYPGNPVFRGFVESGFPTVAWFPSVVRVNGTYLMAFGDAGSNIGLATSTDGIGWSFGNGSVLLNQAGWHNGTISNPSLMVQGRRAVLWYTGSQATNGSSPYVAGIGFAACNLVVVASSVTATVTSVITKTVVSTSISTSIVAATVTVTVTSSPGAPTNQVVVAAALGLLLGAVVAAAALRLARGRARPAQTSRRQN